MGNCKLLMSVLLLGLWGCIAEDDGHGAGLAILPGLFRNDIPQSCIDNSVTEVSCVDVGEDRLLPHPDDCQLFYYCVGDQPICRQCPAKLHFNPTKHVCDYATRAGCMKRGD